MADAAEECLAVTRYFDIGTYDLAEAPTMIETFIQTIRSLFVEGACTQAGYTALLIDQLQKPIFGCVASVFQPELFSDMSNTDLLLGLPPEPKLLHALFNDFGISFQKITHTLFTFSLFWNYVPGCNVINLFWEAISRV